MAYEKVGWKDYPDKTTPINAQNLNHMDDQIAANAEKNDTQDQAIQKNENDISALNLKLESAITTSNIGSQSVNYANASNYANSAGSANAATKAYQDGNGAYIASTYLKGTQNNRDFINRPSVNIGGTICGLIPTYKQNSQGYPVVGLYIQPGTERLIIDWFADGNIIKSYIVTARS